MSRRGIAALLRRAYTALAVIGLVAGLAGASPIAAQGTDDWPMYLGDVGRSGANLAETAITSSTASYLTNDWKFTTGGGVVASPVVANGVLYVGSWDGYEYAVNLSTHQQIWRQFLGISTSTQACYGASAGISSSATVQNGVLYVGGGDGNLYALNTADGSVAWKTFLGATPYYNWSSPVVYNNNVYIGLSAYCDPPNEQGQVLALSQGTPSIPAGTIVAHIALVPNGQLGATVWSSPAVDAQTGHIFVTTGNKTTTLAAQPNAQAILALDPTTLAILDRWQIPASDDPAGGDADFGATPTLFDINGTGYIGALNKNGIYYVLNRANLAAGPVWERNVGGTPLTANSHVSPSCYANGTVFVGTGPITGTSSKGSVSAFAAATGAPLWSAVTSGSVYGAMMCVPGVVVDGQGNVVEVRNASSGHILFSHNVSKIIQGASIIANGVLYAPSRDGSVYAFALHNTAIPQLIFQNSLDAYAPGSLPTGPGTDQWTSFSATGTGFALAVSNAQAASAPNALQISLGNGAGGHANARKSYGGTSFATHAARFHLYLDPSLTIANQTVPIYTAENASALKNGLFALQLTARLGLKVIWFDSTGVKHASAATAPLSRGQWYTVELDQTNAASGGSWSLWINGAMAIGQSTIDTGSAQINTLLVGDNVSSAAGLAGSFSVDDLVTAAVSHIG